MPKHRSWERYFPFGICSLYSAVKEKQYDIKLIDCDYNHKDLNEMMTPEEIARYDIIGIGGLISCYKTVKYDIVPYIRKHAPNAKIVIGGYLGTSIPELLLQKRLCDVVFLGDAEVSFIEYLKIYDDDKKLGILKGVAFCRDGKIINTGERMENICETYIPYYKHIDIEAYNYHLPPENKYYPLVVEIGCPFKCNFCFNSKNQGNRMRTPEDVISEIKVAREKYGYKKLEMMSENILAHPLWVKRFCELLDENRLNVSWTAAGHANTITEEILKKVKEHGCWRIGIGFESYSQKILDAMNKRTKVEMYVNVIRLLRKYNLSFSGTVIFGYPGENEETFNENILFAKKHLLPTRFFWIQVYPKTVLWDFSVKNHLIIDTEKYIESLGDADKFSVNLTEFTDQRLFEMKQQLDDATRLKPGLRLVLDYLRLYGLGSTLWMVKRYLDYSFRSGSHRVLKS